MFKFIKHLCSFQKDTVQKVDCTKKLTAGNSLTVQWLGPALALTGVCVPSLGRELRPHNLHNLAKK